MLVPTKAKYAFLNWEEFKAGYKGLADFLNCEELEAAIAPDQQSQSGKLSGVHDFVGTRAL
jgi:hypothetical protein